MFRRNSLITRIATDKYVVRNCSSSSVASVFLLLSILVVGAGCDRDRMSERGFSLPEGNALTGREAFLYLHCNQCHTVEGDELPVDLVVDEEPYVELGGPVTRVKSYGELVTAIINPSHKLADGYAEELVSEGGESKMYVYNSYMTVQELIDIVMYLQPFYEVIPPNVSYRVYP